ncbi:hypothetical protein Hamer_G025586 [Homarus americanus]|uniref:C2H2-type domain-containing protein n=1 Tax=Homarus americanus TaxID=6706 RepID=A0A8J5MNA1_HOMAM|nr:hypothetical protein Hamer_G025586 [Homarus americanus]
MRFPKIFDGGSFTRRRPESVLAGGGAVEKRSHCVQGEKDSREQSGEAVEKREGCCSVGDGATGAVRYGRSKQSSANIRRESKISLLSKVYGPDPVEDVLKTSKKDARDSGTNKKETKRFSGFGRRFSIRATGTTKTVSILRRSNTLPPQGTSSPGDKSSQKLKLSVPLTEEIGDPLSVSSSKNIKSGNKAARERAQHVNQDPECRVFTSQDFCDAKTLTPKKNNHLAAQPSREQYVEARVSQYISSITCRDGDLSRGSSVCTLRYEGSDITPHYLSASEVAVSEVTSCDLPLVDLTSSDATLPVSPYSTFTSDFNPSVTLDVPSAHQTSSVVGTGTAPFPTTPTTSQSHAKPPVRILNSLSHFLASFRDFRATTTRETYENATTSSSGQSCDNSIALSNYPLRDRSQCSPSSSFTLSSGTGSDGGQESSVVSSIGSQGHRCPQCQVNFLTNRQLLEHWSVFHTHDVLQLALSPLHRLHHCGGKKEEVQRKGEQTRLIEDNIERRKISLTHLALDIPSEKVSKKS